MQDKIVLRRHAFFRTMAIPILKIFSMLKGYKNKSHFKIKKGESYLVLSNHQTDYDGLFIMLSFNRHLYPVATDTLMSNGTTSKLLNHCFGIIPKKKGIADYEANKKMLQVFEEGGSLLLFPEGNRTYAEFQFSFTKAFPKFLKTIKKPVILFNIHGGTGTNPRFANKSRKGPFYGKIKKVLKYEDYKDLSDEELYEIISNNLKVYDSASKCSYTSNKRAEYLERLFFLCPRCGKVHCLVSSGNYIECKECGLKVEYTNNLHLKPNDDNVKIEKMLDWYNLQIRYIKNLEITDDVIFSENDVGIYKSELYEKRTLISKGKIELYKDKLVIGDYVINIGDINIASPTGGNKFALNAGDKSYIVIGNERFNPLKYVLMFNKLETKMKQKETDIYYNLEERKE